MMPSPQESCVQLVVQLSPFAPFLPVPSSHCSPGSTLPLPQSAGLAETEDEDKSGQPVVPYGKPMQLMDDEELPGGGVCAVHRETDAMLASMTPTTAMSAILAFLVFM